MEQCSTCKQGLPIPIQILIHQREQRISNADSLSLTNWGPPFWLEIRRIFTERREPRQKHARPCVFELKALIFDWSNDAKNHINTARHCTYWRNLQSTQVTTFLCREQLLYTPKHFFKLSWDEELKKKGRYNIAKVSAIAFGCFIGS